MAVIGDFMFGFDTDTKNVFEDTLKMIKELQIDMADFCILTPFPGTSVYKELDKQGRLLTKDWSQYSLRNPVFQPKNMTPEELTRGLTKMYAEFYSTKYTIKRIVRGLKLGFYPFFLILARNAVSNMNTRSLFSTRRKKT